MPSFRGARSANPESIFAALPERAPQCTPSKTVVMDSGFLAALGPGMTIRCPSMTTKQSADSNYPVVVDKDVDVTMRDGARLKADVFRPYDDGKFPAILNLGPYQKDKLWI